MNLWGSHVYWSGSEVQEILQSSLCASAQRVLLIVGEGFDPRMTDCARLLVGCPKVTVETKVLRIGRNSEESPEELAGLVRANMDALTEMVGASAIELVDATFDEEDRNSSAPQASDKALEFARQCLIKGYDFVVVDISALPQGLYFPILEVFIGQRRGDFKSGGVSLYVFVSESVDIDRGISALELQEDAYWVPPFRSALTGTDDFRPVIWFPILGEGELEQIERVERLLPKDVEREVCPVLPMPSSNPLRGDRLVREYSTVLQDSWTVDARSIIYSAERNPFHLYGQLTRAGLRYRDALLELGGCRGVISSHSSKLLSLGAVLAASELNGQDFDVALANVDAARYRYEASVGDSEERTHFLIPLLGTVYEE